MPRRGISNEEAEALADEHAHGVLLFESSDRVRTKAKRWGIFGTVLGVIIALFMTVGLTDADPEVLQGALMINGFLAPPFLYSLYRHRLLRRLERRAGRSVRDQLADAAEHRRFDEEASRATVRVGRLVARLPDDLRRSVGEDALRLAMKTGARWSTLAARRDQLQDLPNRTDVRRRQHQVEGDIARMRRSMDELTLALVDLADAADDDDLAAILADVHEAEERMQLLAESLLEVRDLPHPSMATLDDVVAPARPGDQVADGGGAASTG